MQKQKIAAKQEHFIKPASNLELNTLPDFMKSPYPQVKFQSAFPPLTTKVRVRGVYERAGFDVYKPPDKNRSFTSAHRSHSSGNLNSSHRPPNRSLSASQNFSSNSSPEKSQFRSISQNSQNSSSSNLNSPNMSLPNPRYKNSVQNSGSSLSGKSRNFTTPNPSRGTNNSAPNLINTYNHSSAHSNHSPTSTSEKKNSIKNYAQNKLNLKTKKERKPVEPVANNLDTNDSPRVTSDLIIPKIQLTNSNRNSMVSNNIDHHDLSFENDGLHVQQTLPINDEFNHNLETERQIPKINGPRSFYDAEEGNSSDEVPLNFHSERTQSADMEDHVQDKEQQHVGSSQRNSIYEPRNQLNIPDTNKLLQSPAGSTKSESSVESFDEKFMAHINVDDDYQDEYVQNLSHETLGGLGGLRKTINSTEIEPGMIPLVPDVTNTYNQKSKRISTLSTNDMKIYNLQSLNSEDQIAIENSANGNYTDNSYNDDFNSYSGGNQFNEMSIIHEGDSEDHTRSQSSYHAPSNRASSSGIAELPTVNVDDASSLDDNEDALFKDAETGNIGGNVEPTIGSTNLIIDNILSDDDQLLRRGFTKRIATAVDTPNTIYDSGISNTERVVPPVPPLVSANSDSIESINDLINDLDNFQHSSNQVDKIDKYNNSLKPADGFEIPPRHFEKVSQQQQQQQQQNTPVNTEYFPQLHAHNHSDCHANSHTHSHQYNSYSSYSPSDGSAIMPMSSGFTTPDQNTTFEEATTNTFDNTNQVYYPPGEGPCRKCGLPILEGEKKIWSKDNQLSGQWHRACFGCHKCNSKFNKGSSCYVYNDQPYCERHFHELNGSLCKICNKGVEGECLQNEVNEVFHIDCLKCVICGLNVKGDYFIFRNEVMCETDAKELMYQIEKAEKEHSNKDIDKIIKRRTRVLYL